MSAFTVAVKPDVSSMPITLETVEAGERKGDRVGAGPQIDNVETALAVGDDVRTLSISAGLAASTVTPGSTAPEPSLTTPAIPLAVAC